MPANCTRELTTRRSWPELSDLRHLTHAWAWPLIGILALELAVGGLDNLYAHHRRSTGAAPWAARVLGASALLAAALLAEHLAAPALVNPAAAAAFAVTLIGVAIEFWRARDVYLDEKKRDRASAVNVAQT